jgi:hypothetical protein
MAKACNEAIPTVSARMPAAVLLRIALKDFNCTMNLQFMPGSGERLDDIASL